MMRTTNASSQLMNLREPQLIGSVHDDGVSIGNINTSLDDRRADQYVSALVVKIRHHLLELAFAHLAVGNENSGRGE